MDNTDIRILAQLVTDCRESDRQIGLKVGLSGGAVKARIDKMIEEQIIEGFTVKAEPQVFGFDTVYVVVSGQDVDSILKQIELLGYSTLLVPCVGDITVCGISLQQRLNREGNGQLDRQVQLIKEVLKDARILSIFYSEGKGIRDDITKTDLEVLGSLLGHPRENLDIVAKECGISKKTVSRALEKLRSDRTVQFTTIYNPKKLNPFIPFAVVLSLGQNYNRSKKTKLLKHIHKTFSKYFIDNPFDAGSQMVLFMYSKDIFELDDIVTTLRKTNNVENADLFIPKSIRFPHQWILDVVEQSKRSEKLHFIPSNAI